MTLILYPPGVNWFYEALARDVHEDLAAAGVASTLITPHEFVSASPPVACSNSDVLIVNAVECVHTLVGPVHDEARYAACLADLCQPLTSYRRRILLNLDAVETVWFRGQMAQIGRAMTDIFDLGMMRQTSLPVLHGCRYTWIPETFTERAQRELAQATAQRPIPWAVVGHATLERAELADRLKNILGPSGLMFLPGLRPFGSDGTRNLSQKALTRALNHTKYYVWISHHQAPYHEGLRALHAVSTGAVPVKIDPLFSVHFADIPWVYDSLESFAAAAARDGAEKLYAAAREFLLARGTLAFYLAAALAGLEVSDPATTHAPRTELPPRATLRTWPERAEPPAEAAA